MILLLKWLQIRAFKEAFAGWWWIEEFRGALLLFLGAIHLLAVTLVSEWVSQWFIVSGVMQSHLRALRAYSSVKPYLTTLSVSGKVPRRPYLYIYVECGYHFFKESSATTSRSNDLNLERRVPAGADSLLFSMSTLPLKSPKYDLWISLEPWKKSPADLGR